MIVGDDYEIVKKIGQGGMGETFLARQISLDRHVVLKRLTSSSNDEDYEDIKREGRLLASLDHPNAISVIGVVTDAGENYLVEEYFAEGRTLRDVIAGVRSERESLSRERFSHIAVQLISVLKEAHNAGTVHRDVKPENILIDKNDRVKLCDFGIAKNLQTSGSSTTGVKGTWEYLAPELLGQNPTVTPAVDAYGAGYVFFELLCGRSPFSTEQNKGVASLLQDKVSKEPRFEGMAPDWAASEAPLLNDLLSLTPEKRITALNRLKVALESKEKQRVESKQPAPDGSDTRDVLESGEQRLVRGVSGDQSPAEVGPVIQNGRSNGGPNLIARVAKTIGMLGLIALVIVLALALRSWRVESQKERRVAENSRVALENVIGSWVERYHQGFGLPMVVEFESSGDLIVREDTNDNNRFEESEVSRYPVKLYHKSDDDSYDGFMRIDLGNRTRVWQVRLSASESRATKMSWFYEDENGNRVNYHFNRRRK